MKPITLITVTCATTMLLSSCLPGQYCVPQRLSLEVYRENGVILNGSQIQLDIPAKIKLVTHSNYQDDVCREITASSVSFYLNDKEVKKVDASAFSVTIDLIPGKDGIPTAGTGTLKLYAKDNTHGTTTPVRTINYTVKL
jgi:hypothetical protein